MGWIRYRYLTLLIIKMMILVILGKTLGIFDVLNRYLYQESINLYPSPDQSHKSFMLIDASGLDTDALMKIIDEIYEADPRLIIADIFHDFPSLKNEEVKSLFERYPQMLFTIPEFQKTFDNEHYQNRVITYTLYEDKMSNANNMQSNILQFFDHPKPALIFDTVRYVNYNGYPAFAKIYAKEVLKGNTISNLFSGKVVLISTFDNKYFPYRTNSQEKHFLHQNNLGFMLKSAMSDSWLKILSTEGYYLFSVVFILTVILILYIFSGYIKVTVLTLIALTFGLYWLTASYFYILLPLSDMITITVMIVFYLLNYWRERASQEESQVIRSMSNYLHEKLIHTSFFNTDHSWNELAHLINQLFSLQKSIFLEKTKNETHAKEIISINYKFSDIYERRRDYNREPYISAIKERRAIPISRRFFETLEDGEREFIAPLIYFNEIVGFWIFTIKEDDVSNIDRFLKDTTVCSKEVSKLVYERNSFQEKYKKDISWYARIFKNITALEIKNSNVSVIQNNFSLFLKRILLYEIVMDNVYSNVIVYDFFGKVISVNARMNALLQNESIETYTFSASQMLAKLTGRKTEEAVELMRDIVYTKVKHEEVIFFKHTHKKYLLRMLPITKKMIKNKFNENYFMDTYGIVFEFIDFSSVESMVQFKENIIFNSLKMNTSYLIGLHKLIDERLNKVPSDAKEDPKNILDTQIKDIMHKMIKSHSKLETLMDEDYAIGLNGIYPVNVVRVIENIGNALKEEDPIKNLTIDIDSFKDSVYIMAALSIIQKNIKILLGYLSDDSEDDGKITVTIQKVKDTIEIMMRSDGYGIPQEQLDVYLASTDVSGFFQIREELKEYGGSVEITSKLGNGIQIELLFQMISHEA